jgi:hypothetical protein
MLQFGLMDNESFTERAQAAAFIQKNKSWSVGMVDMDYQEQLSSPRGRGAFRTFREPLADVRIQRERVTWG